MDQLQNLQDQFTSDMNRVRELLDLISKFRLFAGSSIPISIERNKEIWPESVDLADLAPRVRTDLPVLSGSILLYACGRFEYFVKEVVIAIGNDYATDADSYADIPQKVRDELFRRTLEVAATPTRFYFEKNDGPRLIKILSDSLNEPSWGASGTIESKLLSITTTNMDSRTFAEVFKRVDYDNLWLELGKQSALKAHLGESADPQCRDAATKKLDEIMKRRNAVAHPTANTQFPGPEIVWEDVNFLDLLSRLTIEYVRIPKSS